MDSVNTHGVFLLIENDATASSMIHCFSLRIVAEVIASVITAVTIDIVDVEVDAWSFVLGPFAFGNRAHLLANFCPSIGCLELVSFSFFQSELIVIFDLMVFNFFLPLLRYFLCEAECLHPESKMTVVLHHRLKLIKADCLIFVVVVFLELCTAYFWGVVFLDDVK